MKTAKPAAKPVAKPARKPAKKAAAKNAAHVTRHPLKAATLLYSSPNPFFRGPVYFLFVTLIGMLVYSGYATKDTVVEAPLKLQRQAMVIQAIGGGLIETVEVGETPRSSSAMRSPPSRKRSGPRPRRSRKRCNARSAAFSIRSGKRPRRRNSA